MAGWYAVTDPSKPPMIGVRYLPMDESEGYLAVRWQMDRYIYEGVPPRIFDILRRHKFAGSYFRKFVRPIYPCVEIKKYDTLVALELDETPAKEKLAALAKERLEKALNPPPVEMTLFGPVTPGSRPKRREKRLIGGLSFEENGEAKGVVG